MEHRPAAKVVNRLDYLDSLRGMASLAVIVVHSVLQSGVPLASHFGQIAFAGQRGVELFYMVSAFTIFYSLDNARPEHHPTRNFFLRRFFRIAPLFYLAMSVFICLTPDRHMTLRFLSGLFFLFGFRRDTVSTVAPGGWSVAVETSFYVLVPFLFPRLRRLGPALLAFVAATLCSAILIYRYAAVSPDYFGVLWFPAQFPVFLLGIITYLVARSLSRLPLPAGEHDLPLGKRSLSALLLLLSLAVFLLSINLGAVNTGWSNHHMLPSCIMFLFLILALGLHPWKLFVNPVTRFLGKISFSIYLSHDFIGWWIQAWLLQQPWTLKHPVFHPKGQFSGALLIFSLMTLLSVGAAVLLWEFVEQPGIRLGRWIIQRLEQRTSARLKLLPGIGELVTHGNTTDAQF